VCLYFMGLNVSNEQIAHELSINESDAYQMTTELRSGIIKKALIGFQGRGLDDVVQPDFCHDLPLKPLLFNGLKNELRFLDDMAG
jgi:hypothetical protein